MSRRLAPFTAYAKAIFFADGGIFFRLIRDRISPREFFCPSALLAPLLSGPCAREEYLRNLGSHN